MRWIKTSSRHANKAANVHGKLINLICFTFNFTQSTARTNKHQQIIISFISSAQLTAQRE
jgi:hypothetical protein